MKVVLICRPSTKGAYSLEQLFATIAAELRQRVEIVEFVASSRWSIVMDAWRLRRLRADIYHVTGDITYFALLLPARRTVLTVPDIGNYLYGLSGLKRRIYKKLWLEWPMRAADAVLAISRQTRESIVQHLDVPADRVEVIGCCHSERFKPAPLVFNAKCPVILQVGTKPYKNVHRLVEALHGIRCRLVLVGALDAALTQQLADTGTDYVNKQNLTSAEVYREYIRVRPGLVRVDK